jgi:hypothetical protein
MDPDQHCRRDHCVDSAARSTARRPGKCSKHYPINRSSRNARTASNIQDAIDSNKGGMAP